MYEKTTPFYCTLLFPVFFSYSEIAMAANAGIANTKIFPANLLGGPYIVKAMKEIFTAMKILATGGIKADKGEISNCNR